MSYMGKVRPTIALTSADIEDGAILNVDVNASAAIANSKMASDTTDASNISSGTVADARLGTIPADITSNQTGITANQDDIALLGFKVAANGSLARYNLVDQSIDAFEDASGVDASASTAEVRNSSNYYSGVGSVTATGGTITTDGDYTVHKFTAGGTFTTDTAQDVEYLVVAGGGGGGNYDASPGGWSTGAGGGAGGYRAATGFAVTATSYSITVGAGGAGKTDAGGTGGNGVDSVFSTITSAGGGGGGSDEEDGADGGSGGGGGAESGGAGGSGNTPSTSPSQGNDGGQGGFGSPNYGSGGGGGAGAVGQDGSTASSGDGGDGTANDILVTGVDVTYAGGGGGGGEDPSSDTAGAGGAGGGGKGTVRSTDTPAVDGTVNTGGGGGGGADDGYPPDVTLSVGADGGSGIVIIRRPTGTPDDMTLISNAQTAEDGPPDNADLVITYTNGAGTATINTDLKAYVSRDGSAYSSAVTLVSQGTTGGHTILTANSIDISGITSGSSMRWKIETLNQSESKDTRIQAVSLGWS